MTTHTADEFALTHSNGIYLPWLSVSTISSFIENRYNFYQSKVMRAPFKGNHATAMGQAIEHAVNQWVENPGKDMNLLMYANEKFDEQVEGTGAPKNKVMEYRSMIPGALEVMLRHYKRIFSETGATTQTKIETTLEGVQRPLIGYLDYFQDGVAVRDSKVVGRSPSKLKQAYCLQGALYAQATGLPVFFDFCILNKTPVVKEIEISEDEIEFGISYLTKACQVLEEIEECESPKRLFELSCFPNLEAFYSPGEALAAAKVWGIKTPLGYFDK